MPRLFLSRNIEDGNAWAGRYSGGPYLVASHYTIADMAVWPWFGNLVLGRLYSASEFLSVEADYPHVMAWAKQVGARLAVKRGRMVTRTWVSAALPRSSN
jgi:GST-like protein